ncbi:MAG: DUF1800 domain-containing protein [Bacteroidetes bacterium]|nr:DUF1800 domain-containing protein [Bacteroidota bacterium]
MNRRDALTLDFPKQQRQDFSNTARTNTGLTPYSGQWTLSEVQHLLRRAMFGSSKTDADYFLAQGMTASISELLTAPGSVPSPPLWTYASNYADPNVAQGQTWVTAPYDGQANGYRNKSYKAWWVGQMLDQSHSILEKMTLFWSNHFSTESYAVNDARYSYSTNALCRQYALGNFKTLTKLITLDSGMLKYLNGYLNTNTAPDENYGRELQELFTVGKDANGVPFYSQSDVIAAAHVLTGYRINSATIASYFDSTRHDTANKTFSSFYGNTVITGQSGANGANELDDLLTMIFSTNEVALFICRKLYRFFVYYEIDAATETNVIQPLATIFRNNNYDILPVLSALLSSEHFFDPLNRGCIIKAPVDILIAMCRDYNVVFPNSSNIIAQYTMWFKMAQYLAIISQNVGDPPNVAGWAAYYQEPGYHELWINSDSLPKRNQFTDAMIYTGITGSGNTIIVDVVAYTAALTTPDDPDLLIQEVIDRHYSEDVSNTVKSYLKNILLSGQASNSYWTNAWNDYLGSPTNMTYYNIVLTRLQAMYKYIMDLSEYQLS